MQFYGAETSALRRQGTELGRGAQGLLSTGSRIMVAVTSASWEGTDAEAFRLRCVLVSRRIEQAAQSLSAFSAVLHDEADEQDRCSAVDGPVDFLAGGSFGGLLGVLGGMTAGPGSGVLPSARIGFGGMPGMSGGGAGMQNSLGTPIDPSIFEPESGSSVTKGSSVEQGGVKRSHDVTANSDGSTTVEATTERKTEFPVGTDAAGGKVTLSLSTSAEVTTHPDGSMTVVFEGSVGGEAEMHAQAKGVEVGAESSGSATGAYTVHLPPGSSFEDALTVNPFDPESIPPGGSVTISGELTAGAGASVGYKDVASVSLGLEGSQEYVTTVSRDMNGILALDRGPGTHMGINYGLQIGPDDANVTVEGSVGTKETTVHHAEFEDSKRGTAAYHEMLLGGGPPGPDAEGVTDAYTDEIISHTSDVSASAEASADGHGRSTAYGSSNAIVSSVKRTYPDGDWVMEERNSVLGPGVEDPGRPHVITHSAQGMEPKYEVVYPINGNAVPNSFHDQYDIPFSSEDQTARIMLTQQEMEQIQEHVGGKYDNVPESAILAYLGTHDGADKMAADYNNRHGDPDGPGEAPGRVMEDGESGRHHRGSGTNGPSPGGSRQLPSRA